MPIKPFEFTSSADIIREGQARIEKLRASGDPQQQQLANNQVLIDAIFGSPAAIKAQETEEAITGGLNLTRDEGESDLDFQIRQQQEIMRGTAAVDPNVAVQANNNARSLMAERQERDKLFASDKRAEEKHKREMAQAADESTPTLDKWTPLTGQWETVEVGKPGEGPVFKERIEQLNSESKDGIFYATGKLSDALNTETPESGEGLSLGKTLIRSTIEGLESVSGTMDSFEPLVNLLEQDNFALQGIKFNKDGTQESSKSNTFFTQLENIGQQFKSGLDAFHQEYMLIRGTNQYVDIQDYIGDALDDPEVSDNLRDRGLAVGIAQGIITDIGYALAKMRDDGRLSDQDVSLAIRSLTGRGGVAEMGELLNVQVRKAKKKVERLRDRISESPGSVPSATIKRAEDAVLHGQRMVSRMRRMAENQGRTTGQTERGGVTPEQGAAYKAKYQ